jgi:hypothetical protein
MRQTVESKQFFFAKKNQKTFVYKALALPKRVRQMDKSSCFFFQKEVLSSCQCVSLKATWYKWLLCAQPAPFGAGPAAPGTCRLLMWPLNSRRRQASRRFCHS